MAGKSWGSNQLKGFSKQVPNVMEGISALKKLSRQRTHTSDRATAIVGGALIEYALMIAIKGKMPGTNEDISQRLFSIERRGILSDLGSRILMGRALGLYGDITAGDLNKIAKIRNSFAHTAQDIHFKRPEVKNICDSMELKDHKPFFHAPITGGPKEIYVKIILQLVFLFRVDISILGKGGKPNLKIVPVAPP